jgi:O-antigen/teichoic acid export membrane protein
VDLEAAGTSGQRERTLLGRLLRDSAIYGLSSVLARGISLLLLPFYTRVLTPSDYGLVDLATVFASLVNLTVALEVSQGLARHVPEARSERDKTSYASTALWFTVAAYTAFALVAFALPGPFARLVFDSERHAAILRLAVVQVWANGIFYLVHGQLRWELRPVQHTVVNIVFTVVAIAATVALVLAYQMGAAGVIIGQTIGYLAGTALALVYARARFRIVFDWDRCREMLRYSVPLVPSSIAVFVAGYIDRIAIKELLTLHDVGIYGVSYRLSVPMLLVLSGFQSAMTPLIITHYREADAPRAVARMFSSFLILALTAWAGLALFGREVLAVFTTPNYYAANMLIPLLAPALILSGMYIFAPGLAIAKHTKTMGAIGIANAVVNTALNFSLIPILGIAGAALATCISAAMAFGAFMILSQRRYPVPHDWTAIGLAVAVTAAVVIINAMWLDGYALSIALALTKGLLLAAALSVSALLLIGPSGLQSMGRWLLRRAGAGI